MVKRSRKTFDDYILEYRIYRNAQGKEFVLVLTLKNDGSLFVIPGMLHDEIIQRRMAQVDATVQLSLDIGDVVGTDAVSKFKYMPAGNGYQNSTEGVSVGYDAYLSTDTKEAGILFHPVFKGDQSGQPQMIKRSRKTFDGYTLEYRIYRNAQGKEFVLVFTLKNDGSLFIIPGMLHDEVIQKRIGQVDAPAQLSLDTRNVVGTEGVSSYKKLPSLLDGYTSSDGSISVKYDAYYSQSKREVGIQFKGDEWQMVERSRKSFFGGSIREYRVYKNARTGKEFVLYIMNMQDGYVGTLPDKRNDVKMRRWMEVAIPLSDNILQDAGKGLMAALDMSMTQKNEPGVSQESQEAGRALFTALQGSVTYEPKQDGKATEVTVHFTDRVRKAISGLWAVAYPEQSLSDGEPSAEELVKIKEIAQSFFAPHEVEVAKDRIKVVFPVSIPDVKEGLDLAMSSGDAINLMSAALTMYAGVTSFQAKNYNMGAILITSSLAVLLGVFLNTKSKSNRRYIKENRVITEDVRGTTITLPRPKVPPITDSEWTTIEADLVKALKLTEVHSIIYGENETSVVTRELSKADAEKKIEDMASTTGEKRSPQDLGGIDLNARNMGLEVARDGKGVDMKFDPAMVAEFQKGDFTGVEGIILRIVPLQSPFQALGMEASPAGDELAKG